MRDIVLVDWFNDCDAIYRVLLFRVYDDVPTALRDWVNSGMRVYAYSSSGVEGQKLLFGYSDKGNLLEVCSVFFF